MKDTEVHVCGECGCNRPMLKRNKLIGFYCGNKDSDCYGCPTTYDDSCEEWREKKHDGFF